MTLRETQDRFRNGELDKAEYVQRMHQSHLALIEYAQFLGDTGISRIEIEAGRTIFTSRETGIRFLYIDEKDCHTTPLTLLNFGAYEADETPVFMMLAQRLAAIGELTFLDIGANVGWYSLNVAKRLPQARIHAFEPVPSVFQILNRNLALNECEHAKAHNMGLLDASGEHTFYYESNISGRTSAADLSLGGQATHLRCPVKTLDQVVQELGIRPALIKCDVEGAELMVFRGGMQTLEQHHPLVFTEMLRKWAARFGYHPNELISLFVSLGYRCHRVQNGRLTPMDRMDEDTVETNFFFLHEKKHMDLIHN